MTDIEAEEVQVQPTITDVVEGASKTSVMSYPSINQEPRNDVAVSTAKSWKKERAM
jgi:hypothetical protein